MKNYEHVFGVDVSKKTVDITHIRDHESSHRKFSNDDAGMKELLLWIEEYTKVPETVLFCMEATGLYCFQLTGFLSNNSIDIWVEQAIQIKKAMGVARGKNDKIDSMRIALYATKNMERLQLWKPMNATLETIKHLAALRERLVETKKKLEVPIGEFEAVGDRTLKRIDRY